MFVRERDYGGCRHHAATGHAGKNIHIVVIEFRSMRRQLTPDRCRCQLQSARLKNILDADSFQAYYTSEDFATTVHYMNKARY